MPESPVRESAETLQESSSARESAADPPIGIRVAEIRRPSTCIFVPVSNLFFSVDALGFHLEAPCDECDSGDKPCLFGPPHPRKKVDTCGRSMLDGWDEGRKACPVLRMSLAILRMLLARGVGTRRDSVCIETAAPQTAKFAHAHLRLPSLHFCIFCEGAASLWWMNCDLGSMDTWVDSSSLVLGGCGHCGGGCNSRIAQRETAAHQIMGTRLSTMMLQRVLRLQNVQ